jgi:dephospho-CoA kinase
MPPTVIAIGGPPLSGKSAVAHRLAEQLAWPLAGFGSYVREVARSRGLDPNSRAELQAIGEELVSANPGKFCQSALTFSGWRGGQSLVIDGVRHVIVLEELRKLVAPLPLSFIFVTAAKAVREERLRARALPGEAPTLRALDEHSTERDVLLRLPAMADVKLDGTEPVEKQISKVREQLGL